MKRSTVPLLATALALLLPGALRAAPIPWSVSWSPSTASISPDNGTASKITLVGGNDSNASAINVPVQVAAAYVSYFSTAPANNPDTFTKKTFDLKVTVTDTTSGKSEDLTFKLQFDGTLSKAGQSLKLTTLPSDPQFTDPLGGNIYRVRLTSSTPPPFYPRNPFIPGVVMATVTVADLKAKGSPEPSSLLLAGLAVPGLWVFCRRRKRQPQGTNA